jgi:hypothetical protein
MSSKYHDDRKLIRRGPIADEQLRFSRATVDTASGSPAENDAAEGSATGSSAAEGNVTRGSANDTATDVHQGTGT